MIFYKKTNPDTPRDFLLNETPNTESIGQNIYYFDVTDSTNNEAKRHFNYPEGTVFLAETQTSGRGRKGRIWTSDLSGLWFSVLLKPNISTEIASQITLIMGLAVSKVINGAFIKWPNDIVMGNKKLAGILTEMSVSENVVEYVVVGIGINVNSDSFPEEISEIATSLYMETGIKHSKEKLLAELCVEIEYWYKLFINGGFSACMDEYTKKCITLNREVIISNMSESYKGLAVGITENGELIVQTEEGETNVLSGEVSVRGLLGYV